MIRGRTSPMLRIVKQPHILQVIPTTMKEDCGEDVILQSTGGKLVLEIPLEENVTKETLS